MLRTHKHGHSSSRQPIGLGHSGLQQLQLQHRTLDGATRRVDTNESEAQTMLESLHEDAVPQAAALQGRYRRRKWAVALNRLAVSVQSGHRVYVVQMLVIVCFLSC